MSIAKIAMYLYSFHQDHFQIGLKKFITSLSFTKSKTLVLLDKGFAAPVRGLEPRTRGLTVHCSNQLSYTGIKIL